MSKENVLGTTKELEELVIEAGNKGAAIEAVIKAGYSYKVAEKSWSEYGARKGVSGGFRASFFDALRAGNLTKKEVGELLKATGSVNKIKEISHWNEIARLVADVRADSIDPQSIDNEIVRELEEDEDTLAALEALDAE